MRRPGQDGFGTGTKSEVLSVEKLSARLPCPGRPHGGYLETDQIDIKAKLLKDTSSEGSSKASNFF